MTPGYYREANCQFPRDIREDGTQYKVKPENINLITTRGKWFYSIKRNNVEEIIKNGQQNEIVNKIKNIKIYEDVDEPNCAICDMNPKGIVFVPCGHFHACNDCASKLHNCPMCLKKIMHRIDRALID